MDGEILAAELIIALAEEELDPTLTLSFSFSLFLLVLPFLSLLLPLLSLPYWVNVY